MDLYPQGWQLWIARNKSIFNDEKVVPARIASKAVGMIAKKFASNSISFPNEERIPNPYSSWCRIYLQEVSPLQFKTPKSSATQPFRTFPWEIRLNSSDFKTWLRERNSYALFFDGASKGNPRVSGAGGILLDPRGHVEQTFTWGLGHRTNNEAEWLALLQGMQSLANRDLSKIMIFGDSRHVIFKMINGYTTGSIKCRCLHDKIIPLMTKSYELFHILCTNNSTADALANMGASLPQGQISLNGQAPHLKSIP